MKTLAPISKGLRPLLSGASIFAFSGAVFFMAGCSSEPESHVVSAPPPSTAPALAASTPVVVQTPATQTSGSGQPAQTVVVTQAPPAPQQETALEQPSPKHVWIPGYWSYRDSHYVWIAGRWELPPSPDAVWVAPRWEKEGDSYRFYEGYWKT